MQPRDLLVEVFRQHVHLVRVVPVAVVRPQLDLREHLVGERVAHHERRMPGRVAEVHEATLAQHEHAATGGQAPLVHLRLDLDLLGAGERLEAGHVDLVVEVPDVGDDREVLHPEQVIDRDDVLVAGAGDENVHVAENALDGGDLVAVHGRLQGADRVDLAHDHAGALTAKGLRSTLADVTVAGDEGDLAADEHIGGPVESVGQRVADSVLVVELALGDRVVDVDRREQQVAGLREFVQAVHAGRGLLGDALDLGGDPGPAVGARG